MSPSVAFRHRSGERRRWAIASVDAAAAVDQVNQARQYLALRLRDHRDVRLML